MTSITFRQIIFRLSIMGVIMGIMINTYDVLFGSVLEAIHILFELIEVVLDKVVESIFDTGVHDTQTIVFYLLIAIGVGICYGLSHVFVRLFHTITDTCTSCKTMSKLYWHDISIIQKILWVFGLILVFIASLMFFGLM
jgi:hypothetical protein